MKLIHLNIILIVCLTTFFSQAEEPTEAPRVGREAAAKYFQKRAPQTSDLTSSLINETHFLSLHVGKFMQSESWNWDKDLKKTDVGDFSVGFTYRMSELNNSMDYNLRVDFNQYKIGNENPLKMSLLYAITFPDVNSKFPIYFGAAAGPGVFFKQVNSRSPLALDYQLIVGARFFNIYENTGFFLESGLKNSLFLTSEGQFNGTYLSGGSVFTF